MTKSKKRGKNITKQIFGVKEEPQKWNNYCVECNADHYPIPISFEFKKCKFCLNDVCDFHLKTSHQMKCTKCKKAVDCVMNYKGDEHIDYLYRFLFSLNFKCNECLWNKNKK